MGFGVQASPAGEAPAKGREPGGAALGLVKPCKQPAPGRHEQSVQTGDLVGEALGQGGKACHDLRPSGTENMDDGDVRLPPRGAGPVGHNQIRAWGRRGAQGLETLDETAKSRAVHRGGDQGVVAWAVAQVDAVADLGQNSVEALAVEQDVEAFGQGRFPECLVRPYGCQEVGNST